MAHMNFLSDLTLADLQDLFNSAITSQFILGEGGWRDGAWISAAEVELLFQQVFNDAGISPELGPAGDTYQGFMPTMNEDTSMNFDIFLRSLNDWSINAQTHADNNPGNKIRVNGDLIPFPDALKKIGEAMKEKAVKQRELELNIFPHDVESMQPYQSNGVTLYLHSGITPSASGAYPPVSQEAQSDIDIKKKKMEIMKSKDKTPHEKQKEILELTNSKAAESALKDQIDVDVRRTSGPARPRPVPDDWTADEHSREVRRMATASEAERGETTKALGKYMKEDEATKLEWLKNAKKDAQLRAMNEDKARFRRMKEERNKIIAEEEAQAKARAEALADVVQKLKEAITKYGMKSPSMKSITRYLEAKKGRGSTRRMQPVDKQYKYGIIQRGNKNFEEIVNFGNMKLESLEESGMDRDRKAEDADVQKLKKLVNDAEKQLKLRKDEFNKLKSVIELESQKIQTKLEKKKKDEDAKKEAEQKEAEEKKAEEKKAAEEEEDIRPVDPTIKGIIADRNFLVGDRIERQDDAGGLKAGTIQQVNQPTTLSAQTFATYNIIYDDGTYEEGVDPNFIRMPPPKPEKVEKKLVLDQVLLQELQDAMKDYGSEEKIKELANLSFSPDIIMIENRKNDIFEKIINKARDLKSGITPDIFGPAVEQLKRRKDMITEGIKKKEEDDKKKKEDAKKKAEAEAAAQAKAEAEAEAKRAAEEEEERLRVKEAFLNKLSAPSPAPAPAPAPVPVAPVSSQPNASARREAFLKRLEQKAKDAKKKGGTRRKLKKRSKQKSRRAKYMRKKSKKRSKQKLKKTKYMRKKQSKKAKYLKKRLTKRNKIVNI